MRAERFYTMLKSNMTLVILVNLVLLNIIFGGIGTYLAEYKHPGANITSLGEAFWWAAVTITTVGYGDYYPVTTIGRIIAIYMMFSGIGIVVLLVGIIAQGRLQRIESKRKSTMHVQTRLPIDDGKTNIINKIEELENLNDEDFETLIIMIKSLRHTLLEEYKILFKCKRCYKDYHIKPKFCSNCGLDLK